MMTNGEKYKTPVERVDAFLNFCDTDDTDCIGCPLYDNSSEPRTCAIHWLDLEAEEEKPLPCPFCGNKSVGYHDFQDGIYVVFCKCGYESTYGRTKELAISAHNRVAKAVKESEVK